MNKYKQILFTICILLASTVIWLLSPLTVLASLSQDLRGLILLQVESKGEAWYVYPDNLHRYYLGRPSDAFRVMRELGLGIVHTDLEKYLNSSFPVRLSGKIMLDVENNGEAYYVYPKDLKGYFLGRPTDAFDLMIKFGLGITNANLASIQKEINNSYGDFSSYENKNIKTVNGEFNIDLITIKRNYPNLKIQTATGDSYNCQKDCSAKPLADYVQDFNGFTAIHGAYFCPPDYPQCASEINFYYWPFYNSQTGFFANEERIKWTEGPIIFFDTNNQPYFFIRTKEIYTPQNFTNQYQTTIRAAISSGPALFKDGKNVLAGEPMDDKQKTVKSLRGGFGYDDNNFYLIIASNATVPDLGMIFETLGIANAINLDGGGSSAMIYNGEYKRGPGRKLPTAIIFTDK